MIIYCYRKTGEIVGCKLGRVHDEKDIAAEPPHPTGMDPKEILKFVVPYKKLFKDIEEPKFETRVVDKETGRIGKVQVGVTITKRQIDMVPTGLLGDFLTKVEKGEVDLYQYKAVVENDTISGFVKLPPPESVAPPAPKVEPPTPTPTLQTEELLALTKRVERLEKLLEARGPKPKLADPGPVA